MKRAARNREAMITERFFDIRNLPCFLYVYAANVKDMQDFWTNLVLVLLVNQKKFFYNRGVMEFQLYSGRIF